MDKRNNGFLQSTGQAARKIFSIRGAGQVIVVSAFFILMAAVFQIFNPNFLGSRNVSQLLRQIAPFVIAGIGQSFVLITGNIDLSIGSVVGMSCMTSATLMNVYGINPVLAILITLVACLMMGALNGVLVANFKLPPFIATLGTMTIARGIAQFVNNGRDTDPIIMPKVFADSPALTEAYAKKTEWFTQLFYYGHVGPIFYSIFLALVIWGILFVFLTFTKSGRHMYAIGSNIEAAKMSGISVPKTTIKAYLVSAFCAGVVGLIMTAQTGQGSMNAGGSYELFAVAASVIGGVSTMGGQGTLVGTIVGAFIWAGLANGLSILGASLALQNLVVGTIVIISVLSDVVIRRRKG